MTSFCPLPDLLFLFVSFFLHFCRLAWLLYFRFLILFQHLCTVLLKLLLLTSSSWHCDFLRHRLLDKCALLQAYSFHFAGFGFGRGAAQVNVEGRSRATFLCRQQLWLHNTARRWLCLYLVSMVWVRTWLWSIEYTHHILKQVHPNLGSLLWEPMARNLCPNNFCLTHVHWVWEAHPRVITLQRKQRPHTAIAISWYFTGCVASKIQPFEQCLEVGQHNPSSCKAFPQVSSTNRTVVSARTPLRCFYGQYLLQALPGTLQLQKLAVY